MARDEEIVVLKCASCETFQSQIVKKTNKWECKVCGTKQSIKKVYAQGSGKDCRLQTQKLNALKGERDNTNKNKYEIDEKSYERQSSIVKEGAKLCDFSKWSKYIDKEQLKVSTRRNNKNPKIPNDVDTKIKNSSCIKKRKYNTEQSSHNKSFLDRSLQHIPFQTNFNSNNSEKKIKNTILSQTTNKNIYVKDKIIKTQSKNEEKAQTSSVKLENYLKVEVVEEFSENLSVTALKLFPTKPSGSENSEPNTFFSSKNNGNPNNFQTLEKSMAFSAFHSSPGLCTNNSRKHMSKDKQTLPDVQHFCANNQIPPEHLSNKQLLVSSQDFECNFNLTDVDFQLDF